MKESLKKRGQKLVRRFSRASIRASEEGKEHIKENFIGRLSHILNIKLLIFEWGLLIFALIMLAVTQSFWYGESYAQNTFVGGGTFIEGTIGEVNSLNPLFATTNSEKVLSRLMFSTLTTIDYSGQVGLGLAKSITPSENGRVWTMKIRDGVKWSDGEPLTKDDVMFTLELIKNPAVSSVYSSSLSNVKIAENEDGTISFTLPVAYADFMSALNIPIVPKHVLENADVKTLIENEFSTMPVTSGAFLLNAVQNSNTGNNTVIYLTSNQNYYKGKAKLNNFALHIFDNESEVINALNAGTIMATAEVSSAQKSRITASQFNQKDSQINSGAFIFFNTSNGIFKSTSLRSAVRSGINLETIRGAAPGTTKLDYPILSSAIHLSRYPELPGYDPEASAQKIAETLTENEIPINISTVSSGYLPDVANALKMELTNLGFNAEVKIYEEGQDFISNVIAPRNYDILVYEIELGVDPDPLPYFHSSQASSSGLNLSNYRSAMVDDLLIAARQTLDESLRAAKYETFLEHFVSDVPAIGLYQANLTYYYNKNVRIYGDGVRLVSPLDRFSDILDFAVNKQTRNKTP